MSQLNDAWSWGQDSSETNEDNSGSTDPIDWDDNNSWGQSWDNNETAQTDTYNNEKINKPQQQHITQQHNNQQQQQGMYDNIVNTGGGYQMDDGYRTQQNKNHDNNNDQLQQYQYHQYQQEQYYTNNNTGNYHVQDNANIVNGNFHQQDNANISNENIHNTTQNNVPVYQNGGLYAQQQTGYTQYNNHNVIETNNQNSWYNTAGQTGTYQGNQTSYEQVQSPLVQNITQTQSVTPGQHFQNIANSNTNANLSEMRHSVSPSSARNINNSFPIEHAMVNHEADNINSFHNEPQAMINYQAENNQQALFDNVENIATTMSISLGGGSKNSWYQDDYSTNQVEEFNNVSESFNQLTLNQGNELNQLSANEVPLASGDDTSVPFNQETLANINSTRENVASNILNSQENVESKSEHLESIQENVELIQNSQQEQVARQSDSNEYAFNDNETNAGQQTPFHQLNSGQPVSNETNCPSIETFSNALRSGTETPTHVVQNTNVIQNMVDNDSHDSGFHNNSNRYNMTNQTEHFNRTVENIEDLDRTIENKTENIKDSIHNTANGNNEDICNTVEINSVTNDVLEENISVAGVSDDKTTNTVDPTNTSELNVNRPDLSQSMTPPIPTDRINTASPYDNIGTSGINAATPYDHVGTSDRNMEIINTVVTDNKTNIINKVSDRLKGGPKKYMTVAAYNEKFGQPGGAQSNENTKADGKDEPPNIQNKTNENSKAQDRNSFNSAASDKLSRLRRSTEKTTKDRNQYLETGELRDSRSPSDEEDDEDEAPSFVRMIPGSEMSDPNQTQPSSIQTTSDKITTVKKSIKSKRVSMLQSQQGISQPSDSASADEEEEEEEEDKKLMKIIKTLMLEEKAKKKEKAKKSGGKESLENTALRIAKMLKAQKLSSKAAVVSGDSDDSDHAQIIKEEEEEHNVSLDSQKQSHSRPARSREGGSGGGGMSHFEQYLQSMSKRKDRSSKPSIASSSPIPLEERQSSSVSLLDKSQRYSNDRHYHDSSMSLLDKSQRHYSERTLQRPFPQRTPPTQMGGYPDRPYPQRTPPTQGGYPDRPFPQRTPPVQGYPERSFSQRTPPLQSPYSDRYPDRSFSQQGGGGPPSFTDSSTLERRRKISGDNFSAHIGFLDSILANFPAVTTEDQRQRMRQLSLVFPLEYNAWYRERYMPTLERYKQAVNERKMVLRNRVTKQFGRHCVGKSRLNALLKFEGRHIHEYNIDVGKAFHQTEDSNFFDDIELLTPFTFDNEDRKCFYGFVQSMIHRATSLSEQLLYQLIELMFKSKGEVELSDIGDLLLRSYSKVRGLQYLHYPDTLLWKPNNSSEVKLKLRQHAVNDQKQKAFQLALQSKDWALASVLASAPNSCLSQSELHQSFLSTIPDNDPLRSCFQMMFNQSVQVNTSSPIDLNDWGIHLAAILNNSTQHTLDTGAVLKLGHSLGDRGDYYGEQFCSLIVNGAPWSRFKVLGAPFPAPSTTDPASVSLAEIVTGRNILLTMACENASKLGPQPAAYQFVQLQYMKYYFSLKLFRLGKIKLAVHFLHHAAEEVLSHLSEFCTPKHLPLLEQIVDLATLCAGLEARGFLWYSQLSAVLEQHLPSRRLTLTPLTQPAELDPPRRDSNPGPSYSSDPQYTPFYSTTESQYTTGRASYGDTGPQSLPYNGAPSGVPKYEGNGPSVPTFKPYGALPTAGPGYQDPMGPLAARQTPINTEMPVLNPMPSNPLNTQPLGTVKTGVKVPQEPLSKPAASLRSTRAAHPPVSAGGVETRPAPPPQSQFLTPALIPDAESTYLQHLQDSESSTSMNVISLNSSFSYAQEEQKTSGGSNSQPISSTVTGKPPSGASSGGGGWFGFLKKNNPPVAQPPVQNNTGTGQQDSSDARAPTPSQYPAPSYSAPPTNSGGGFMQPYSTDYSNPSGQYQSQQQSYSRSSSPASSLSTEVRYYTSRRPSWNQQQYRYAPR